MSIDNEFLLKRKEELEQKMSSALNVVQQFNGAICIINELIAHLNKTIDESSITESDE